MPPNWLTLRALGSSGAARYSYLFPLVGYALLFNSYVSGFLAAGLGLNELEMAGAVKQLYFVYFGFLFFSLASITYAAGCSQTIKRYRDEAEFVIETNPTFSSSDLLIYAERIVAAGKDDSTTRRAKSVPPVVQAEGVSGVEGDLVLEIRKRYFAIEADSAPFWRGVCAFLYALGGLLLLIPTASGIVRVANGLLAG